MKLEITSKPTQTINYSTAFLVFLLAAGSFVLSYSNLYETGLSLGLSPRLAWIWPLLVDFALIVFSLAVVRASLHNERTWWPWLLVALYTGGTVGFNIYHAPANLAAQVVAVVAPVSLFLSFETLMGMLKSGVRRSGAIQSIAQITAKLAELEGLYRARQDKLEAELTALEGQRLAEIEANRLRLIEETGQLKSQRARLTAEVEAKANTLASYIQDIEARREELKGLDNSQAKIYVPANLSIEQRRELVNRMSQEGLTIEAIASALKCSPGTVKNDKAAMKMVSPVDLPATTGGINGKH